MTENSSTMEKNMQIGQNSILFERNVFNCSKQKKEGNSIPVTLIAEGDRGVFSAKPGEGNLRRSGR